MILFGWYRSQTVALLDMTVSAAISDVTSSVKLVRKLAKKPPLFT